MSNIEDICITLELAQKLKELGVKQKSLFYWVNTGRNNYTGEEFWQICNCSSLLSKYQSEEFIKEDNIWAAFTSEEIGGMLPGFIAYDGDDYILTKRKAYNGNWLCYYEHNVISNKKGSLVGCLNPVLSDYEYESRVMASLLINILTRKPKPILSVSDLYDS